MNKKETSLIERFKTLESELIEALKPEDISFDDDAKKQVVKSQLKGYIKKVEKARKLFDEYEQIAEEIEKMTHADAGDISAEVVGLREDVDPKEKEIYIQEIIAEQDGVKVAVKKKKKSSTMKEF